MTAADVAGEAHPRAVGRDVDFLVDVGAVEHQRVVAGLALDGVAAVARVPDERVVAGAEQRRIVAGAADDGSSPWLPIRRSLPSPPFRVRPIAPAGEARRIDRIVAAPDR